MQRAMWSHRVPDDLWRWFAKSDHDPSSLSVFTPVLSCAIRLQSNHQKLHFTARCQRGLPAALEKRLEAQLPRHELTVGRGDLWKLVAAIKIQAN